MEHKHDWSIDSEIVLEQDLTAFQNAVRGTLPVRRIFAYCSCGAHLDYDEIRERLNKHHDWISVEDKLPEFGDVVLVAGAGKDVVTNFLMGDEINGKTGWAFLCYTLLNNNYVTHWMPLPEPPKEQE